MKRQPEQTEAQTQLLGESLAHKDKENIFISVNPPSPLTSTSQWTNQEYNGEMPVLQSASKTATWETKIAHYGDHKCNSLCTINGSTGFKCKICFEMFVYPTYPAYSEFMNTSNNIEIVIFCTWNLLPSPHNLSQKYKKKISHVNPKFTVSHQNKNTQNESPSPTAA